jgi:putative transposase
VPSAGLLHHSDRGSVYASGDYGNALLKIGALKSMSRKADCCDNAVAESFFATIKGEMIDHEQYETRAEATAAIGDYIEASTTRVAGIRRSATSVPLNSN